MKRFMRHVLREWQVLALLVLGVSLRLVWLGDVPGGLNQDEASIGYDAWAILHHGIDRNGHSWPVHLVAWGSGQNALYAYLSMPFIALAGLSTGSLRMLAAFSGVLVLWLFWYVGRRDDRDMGICALVLVLTSPWHILASRWALESNILPAVVLGATTMFLHASREHVTSFIAGCALLTASVYAYGPAYLFAPLYLLCTAWLLWRRKLCSARQIAIGFACAAALALPMMGFLLNNALGSDTLQFGPFSLPRYSGPARYGSIFLPFSDGGLLRTLDNARAVLMLMFCGADDGMPANAIPGFGAHYAWLLPFSVWGVLWSAGRQARLQDRLMLVWLICGFLTASMTEANINRINLVWLPLLWMSARGVWCLGAQPSLQRSALVILLVCCLFFSLRLFGDWNRVMSSAFFSGLRESIAEAIAAAPAGASIAVTDQANMPYITALFESRVDPASFIRTARIPDRSAAFQQVESFDRFVFGLGGTPEDPAWRYWVVHRSELGRFNAAAFASHSHGDYAFVQRRDARSACEEGVSAERLSGVQDWGTIGADGPVSSSGAGFGIAGGRFLRGLGVHGESRWVFHAERPAQAFRAKVGISDDAACSDGMRFLLEANGRTVFDSGLLHPGQLVEVRADLDGAQDLAFVTRPGSSNACDHGNWLDPVVLYCAERGDAERRSAGHAEAR